MKTILVIDDFYRDFGKARRMYEKARFKLRGSYAGKGSTVGRQPWLVPTARRVSDLIGIDVPWDWKRGAGTFRTLEYAEVVARRQQVNIHCDPHRWVCTIYMNREAECHGGTAFYRHKETGLLGFHDVPAARRVANRLGWTLRYLRWKISQEDTSPARWEMVDRIAMRENRAVICDGRLFHSHWLDLAWMKRQKTPRVIQVFFSPPIDRLSI